MKLKQSTKLHFGFIAGILLSSLWWPLLYHYGFMANAPLWFKIAFPVFCQVMLYIWFLQHRSADKNSLSP